MYAAAVPTFTASYSGFTNGDSLAKLTATPALGTTATAGSPVGNYPIHGSGGVSSNYAFLFVDGTLAVLPATPALTWTNPTPISYGTLLGSNQLNASTPVPGNFTYSPTNGALLKTGTNTLLAFFTPTDSTDYLTVTGSVSLTVFLMYDGVNLSDPIQSLADPDGDGFSSLAEYALGSDPRNPSDSPSGFMTSVITNGGTQYLTLQYKRRHDTSAFPIQYIPEVSADQQTWYSDGAHAQETAVVPLDSQFDWVTVRDQAPLTAAAPQFFRLRITTN